ncbi:ninjurin-2-like [Xiphophorus maculatus]|uniref:ninjurin-2-like n=1 Tax=Xiphophorus maculatus TaxID=8083 RepID=UPI000C6CF1DD|nr:ninjurin-2-like [Xiphophorus maculatus]
MNREELPLNAVGDYEGQSGKRLYSFDMNHYATKKSAAQSMLDVALLMANSSQLKTILHVGPEYRFYVPLIVLLALSITLQVVVGLLLVFIVKYNLNDERKRTKLETMNNMATVFVFFTVLINIFIAALGFQGQSMSAPVIPLEPQLPPLPVNLTKTRALQETTTPHVLI